jgi:[NiFe] hydrogenase diaphorase moiety small subunit
LSEKITFILDGTVVQGEPGQTIMQAADPLGNYIPRLCAHKDLVPYGSCRVCTVLVNGRPQAACIQTIAEGILVENRSEKVLKLRKNIIEMLFVEGNHFCMFCEKSGNCELQALAYRFGIMEPKYPYQFPQRDLDASHPDIFIDRNRCILCGRCMRASRDIDHKNVFQFVGRGPSKRIAVNSRAGLGGTNAAIIDKAMEVCPVGAILKKRVGYAVPFGRRLYDRKPIGTEIEKTVAMKST